MGMSRLEINFRRLLSQCEQLAKDDQQNNWRLEKYVGSLDEMVADLQKLPSKPEKDTMSEYVRRVTFLKRLIETNKLPSLAEKVVAAQMLSHGPATSTDTASKEIHQKTTAKYSRELRGQLFNSGKAQESEDNVRQRKGKASTEDLDVLLKYHHSMQEKIAEDMLLLARNLKEQSQLANTIIKKDTETVQKSSQQADNNLDKLKVASDRLGEHSRRAWKCWLWVMIAAVVVIFIYTVLFMKLFKKSK
ncbi:vesicle transport protein USE1 [Bacillus rossius redtenbacheri]|uniref:vesicle transport protein USE1 n=1 Tax=Bacillus rossius redtenbacheri TaxID=93214 RepID=UPI002FDD2EAB